MFNNGDDKGNNDKNNGDLISGIRNDDVSKYTIEVSDSGLPPFLEKVQERLEKRVIGQIRPIRRAMRRIAAYYARLNDSKRPLGIFLFAGPSGSGKTYTAEELAYALIGDPEAGLGPLVKIDCGGLSLRHTVASLTGSPPGYIGYGDTAGIEAVGQYEMRKLGLSEVNTLLEEFMEEIYQRVLIKQIRPSQIDRAKKFIQELRSEIETKCGPFRSVVLFDEIEKADMNIQAQLLRILDEGILQLQNGRVVNLRASIIILTTNVGTKQILDDYLSEKKLGFKTPKEEKIRKANGLNQQIWRRVKEEIKRGGHFIPELLSRIGEKGIIVFHALDYEDYQKILDLQLKEVGEQLSGDLEKGPGALTIFYIQRFKDFLIEKGISPEYGARALKNIIDTYVRTEIANKILSKDLKVGDKILMDVDFIERVNEKGEKEKEAEVKIKIEPRPEGIELPDFKTRFDEESSFKAEEFLQRFFKSKPKESVMIKEVKKALKVFLQKLIFENRRASPKQLRSPIVPETPDGDIPEEPENN